jgi:putative acetyltransferase
VSAATRAVRAFAEGDLPALVELWVAAWKESGFAIDFDARRAWIETDLKALDAKGDLILVGLDADERPAGFVTLNLRTGFLDQLCVAPGERGSGLAAALLNEAKGRSSGLVELEVNEGNGRARRFYEREGFAVVAKGVNPHSGLPTLKMRWAAGS